MAPMILQSSSLCKDDQSGTIAILIQDAQVLYGLRVENLPISLWEASFVAICERFNGIQIHDIQNSFRYSQIEKRQYTTLTRDELIEPIQTYWMGRMLLLSELERFENISKEEEDSINKDKEFKNNVQKKYISCLDSGKWTGNESEAHVIAKNFKDIFDQPTKNEIWKEAKIEHFKRKDEAEKISTAFVSVPSPERIFSRMIIEKCLERKYKFIHD